jgi:branched-chain amino acid transport system permease protein
MFDLSILWASVLNGVTTGAIYALIALGLTLIYGVLHIVNFAHGAALMVALYGVYFLFVKLHVDPYAALPIMIAAMFVFGYVLQRVVIARARGNEQSVLLVTLGISIVLTNLALFFFKSDTNTIDTPYSLQTVDVLGAAIPLPKVVAFFGALAAVGLLLLLIHRTSLGRAIRAVSREQRGARVVGIDVERIYALSFGIGLACVGAAACFLLPAYYVNPQVGDGFVLIAFTIVVLGGMGSFMGALWGGLIIGVVESLGGLWFGDSLGQIGIFLLFVAVLAFRPQGMFGHKGA